MLFDVKIEENSPSKMECNPEGMFGCFLLDFGKVPMVMARHSSRKRQMGGYFIGPYYMKIRDFRSPDPGKSTKSIFLYDFVRISRFSQVWGPNIHDFSI